MIIEYSNLDAIEKVKYIQQVIALCNVESLNRQVTSPEGESSEIGQFIADTSPSPDELIASKLASEKILEIVNTLRPREQTIIKLRFGLEDGVPRTLDEIGQMYGITRERIRQVETSALRKLRLKLIRNGIKSINDI